MTSRQLVRTIIDRKPVPRCGFWLGNPHPDTWPILHRYFGTSTEEELRRTLGDDFRWITPQFIESTFRHPRGEGLFDVRKYKKALGDPGPLAAYENIHEIDSYDWPRLEYLDLSESARALRNAGDCYRASGFWAPFYHDVMDLFGIEALLTKMYTHPVVVDAVLDHVCGFYYEANEMFFREAGAEIDGYFFGNDFGTQRDIMISPAHFDRFFLPWIRRFADQAHRHGFQVILHSCGSIHRIMDRLIQAGIDCLHPLQARAHSMDAVTLSREFRGRIAFLGGIDTQELLVRGTAEDVKADVRRVKSLLGTSLIVSPSHEALLPDIPPANIEAMAEAAVESQKD